MKLFITGATGFIGQVVTERALQLGHDVKAVSLHGGNVAGLKVEAVDVEDEQSLRSYCADLEVDAVVHLACRIPHSFADVDARDVLVPNMLSTLLVLEASVRMKAKKFVYSSSSSVYSSQGGHFSEDTPIRSLNFYSTSKYFGELLCEQFTATGRLRCISLRISAPYGPSYPRLSVIQRFIKAALEHQDICLWGSGKRSQDFTYIDDVVDAIFLALDGNVAGAFNIASGQTVTMRELAEKVISAVPGCSSQIVYSGEPDPQEDYAPYYDLDRANKLLGYQPKVGLDEGLRCIVDFMAR